MWTTQNQFPNEAWISEGVLQNINTIGVKIIRAGFDTTLFPCPGGLTNGIVLRVVNGRTWNIWDVHLNAEFANLAYDYQTFLATNPAQGVNGLAVRYTFAGQDKHGVAVRLEPGDSLQLVIQDDLSDLVSFRIIAEGHIVQD